MNACPTCVGLGSWPLPYRCPQCLTVLYPRNALGRFVPRFRLRTRLSGAADTNRARAWHTTHATTLEFRDEDAESLAALKRDKALRAEGPAPKWLDTLVSELLTRATILAAGNTTSMKTKIRATHSEASAPTNGCIVSAHVYRSRYEGARTNLARLSIVAELQDALTRARHAPDRSLMRGTLEWRKKIATDSRSARVCASVYGVNKETVIRMRRESFA